jgi:hypothetical protein
MTAVNDPNPVQALAALFQQPPRVALSPPKLSSDALAVHREAIYTHQLAIEAKYPLTNTPSTCDHEQRLSEPTSVAKHTRNCNCTRRANLTYETCLHIYTAHHTGFQHGFNRCTIRR